MKRLWTFKIPIPHKWNSIRPQLCWVYRARVGSSRQVHIATRGPAGSITILKGTLQLRTAWGSYQAMAGETILVPEGERFLRSSADIEVLSVGVRFDWRELRPVLDFPGPIILNGKASDSLRSHAESLFKTVHGKKRKVEWADAVGFVPRDMSHHADIQSELWKWLGCSVNQIQSYSERFKFDVQSDPRVDKLIRYLSHASFDQRLPLEDYARELGLSWRRLEQLFKAQVALTPSEYFEHRRILAAYQLLIQGEQSVKEIAHALGFAHQSSFSRWFASHYGIPPGKLLGHRNAE